LGDLNQVLWWHEKELGNKEVVMGVDHPDTMTTLEDLRLLKRLYQRKMLAEQVKSSQPVKDWFKMMGRMSSGCFSSMCGGVGA